MTEMDRKCAQVGQDLFFANRCIGLAIGEVFGRYYRVERREDGTEDIVEREQVVEHGLEW